MEEAASTMSRGRRHIEQSAVATFLQIFNNNDAKETAKSAPKVHLLRWNPDIQRTRMGELDARLPRRNH